MKNKFRKFLIPGTLIIILIIPACDKDLSRVNCDKVNAKYATDIFPLVQSKCVSSGCHNANSSNGDFTTHQGLKAVSDNGKLEEAVIIDKRMPPSAPLSKDERKKFRCWIDQGAPNN